jgi:hypothetical protein
VEQGLRPYVPARNARPPDRGCRGPSQQCIRLGRAGNICAGGWPATSADPHRCKGGPLRFGKSTTPGGSRTSAQASLGPQAFDRLIQGLRSRQRRPPSQSRMERVQRKPVAQVDRRRHPAVWAGLAAIGRGVRGLSDRTPSGAARGPPDGVRLRDGAGGSNLRTHRPWGRPNTPLGACSHTRSGPRRSRGRCASLSRTAMPWSRPG